MLTTKDWSNGMTCKLVWTCSNLSEYGHFSHISAQCKLCEIWIQYQYFLIRPHTWCLLECLSQPQSLKVLFPFSPILVILCTIESCWSTFKQVGTINCFQLIQVQVKMRKRRNVKQVRMQEILMKSSSRPPGRRERGTLCLNRALFGNQLLYVVHTNTGQFKQNDMHSYIY